MKVNNPFVPAINIPQHYAKLFHKLFTGNAGSGILGVFYHTDQVVREGTPMKLGATQNLVVPAAQGEGAQVIGLSLQKTYDESQWDPQLQNYYIGNQTGQRLDGQPISILAGSGYALTKNYKGEVNWGDRAYVGPSGTLVASGNEDDRLPVVFEESGTDGDVPVRIRFDFPFA